MKMQVLGFFAIVAIANAGLVPLGVVPTTTLVRSPVLDSSIVRSERIGDSFAYSTVTSNGYTSYIQGIPSYYHAYNPYVRQVYIPQYHPSVVYPPTVIQSNGLPAYYPTYATYPTLAGVPVQPPQAPGVNPQNPVEVEDPADNATSGESEKENVKVDEDTVSVESA